MAMAFCTVIALCSVALIVAQHHHDALKGKFTDYVRNRVQESGYIFLPETPFDSAEAFAEWWLELFPARQFDYSFGAVAGRRPVAEGVYVVKAETPEVILYPHIEASYLSDPPEYMAIICLEPSRDGTGTLLTSSARIQREVKWRLPKLYDGIMDHGVTYTEYFPSSSSPVFEVYQDHHNPTALRFTNVTRDELLLHLRKDRPGAEVKTDPDGSIWCSWTLPGFVLSEEGPKWMNSILLSHELQYDYVGNATPPWQVSVGGQAVTAAEWLELRAIHEEEFLTFFWRRTSTLVWNNLEFHHGRMALSREIAADRYCLESYAGYMKRDLALRQDLALTHRLMVRHDITESIWTHITAKLDDSNVLLTPFGLLFSEVNASSLVAVELRSGIRIRGVTGHDIHLNPTALPVHRAVYAACLRCTVAIHAHHPAISAVSALEEGFIAIDQSFFGLPPIFYVNSSAVVLDSAPGEGESEADHIMQTLAGVGVSRGLIVLRNHGVISFGTSVAGAYLRLWYAVRVAKIQVMAMSMSSAEKLTRYPDPFDEASINMFQSEDGMEFAAWRRLELSLDNSFLG